MSDKIKIVRTDSCDTRSPNIDKLTAFTVAMDTLRHQEGVRIVSEKLFEMGLRQIERHDFTKDSYLSMFTRALKTGFKEDEFRNLDWFKDIHCKQERHHLNDRCPEDVNLIDIIEMVVDCVCAFKARSIDGEFKGLDLDIDILQRAVTNTSQLLLDSIDVVDIPTDNSVSKIIGPYDKPNE